jgi:hypothetical protein
MRRIGVLEIGDVDDPAVQSLGLAVPLTMQMAAEEVIE